MNSNFWMGMLMLMLMKKRRKKKRKANKNKKMERKNPNNPVSNLRNNHQSETKFHLKNSLILFDSELTFLIYLKNTSK